MSSVNLKSIQKILIKFGWKILKVDYDYVEFKTDKGRIGKFNFVDDSWIFSTKVEVVRTIIFDHFNGVRFFFNGHYCILIDAVKVN